MVGLADQREAAVLQARDERHPPERAQRVQRVGEQDAGQVAQVRRARGRREAQRVDVARDVESRVVGPVRVAEPERGLHDAAAEAREPVEAGIDVAPQRRQARRRPGEPQRPPDVQRCAVGLEIEEGGVERAEAVGFGGHGRSHPATPGGAAV